MTGPAGGSSVSSPTARRELLRRLLAARAFGGGRVLSVQQERLWVAHHLDPVDPSQNLRTAIRLRGPLDVAALEACFSTLVRDHEQLRATFHQHDGVPLANISDAVAMTMRQVDLRRVAPRDQADERDRIIRDEASRPFDLEQGPPLRLLLLSLDDQEHVLVLTLHHIVCDAWSMDLLLRQLGDLYDRAIDRRAARPSTPNTPSAPNSPYGAYAEAQLAALAGGSGEDAEVFWRRQLDGYRPEELLPLAARQRANAQMTSRRLSLDYAAPLGAAVDRLAKDHGATSYMVLLAAFSALLHRLSTAADLVVASPVANRERQAWEGIVGYFVNLLPLRVRVEAEASFEDLLAAVRRTVLEAHAHQQLPIHRIAEVADLRPASLLRVLFQHVAVPMTRIESGGLVLEPSPIDLGRARHDLSLTTFAASDGLRGTLEYSSDLVPAQTARQLLRDLEAVLTCLTTDPAAAISELPISSSWSSTPAGAKPQLDVAATAPRDEAAASTDTEERLAAIWRDLLALESVSRFDNFLDIGGDSLLAMQVIDKVEHELGVRLAPADLFTQTLAQLAASCERRRG